MRKRLQLSRTAMHSAAVLCSVYFVWFFIREDPKDALRKSFPVSCKSNQLYDTYKHGDSVDKIVNPAYGFTALYHVASRHISNCRERGSACADARVLPSLRLKV